MHLEKLHMHDPQPAAFECKPDEDGASVYWSEYAKTAEQVYMHIGLCGTFQDKNVLKNWREFKAWPLIWSKLSRYTTIVEKAEHCPTIQPVPFPRGIPGNRSHSIICFKVKGKLPTAQRALLSECVGEALEHVDVQSRIDGFDGRPFI
jgi:hypothetical protein